MPATELQIASIVTICLCLALYHRWPVETLGERIVGHDTEAIWTQQTTTQRDLWGKTGRKVDPTGVRPDGVPIIDVAEVRHVLTKTAIPIFRRNA